MIEFRDSPFMRYFPHGEGEPADPVQAYARHAEICGTYLTGLPEAKAGHRYAPGKWSVRELAGHLTDADLIFLYRIVCLARGETKALPGFEEDAYVASGDFDRRPWSGILDAWRGVSQAVSRLIAGIPAKAWDREGCANGVRLNARQMLSVLMGHERHHLRVLQEKYGLT